MSILKKAAEDVVFQTIAEGPFAGTQICEVFDTKADTRMSCGIHELSASETLVDNAPVDDVLFILEGEIEIEADGVAKTYRAGDFAYLHAGAKQRFTVRDRVKHIYVCYPGNWKEDAQQTRDRPQ